MRNSKITSAIRKFKRKIKCARYFIFIWTKKYYSKFIEGKFELAKILHTKLSDKFVYE